MKKIEDNNTLVRPAALPPACSYCGLCRSPSSRSAACPLLREGCRHSARPECRPACLHAWQHTEAPSREGECSALRSAMRARIILRRPIGAAGGVAAGLQRRGPPAPDTPAHKWSTLHQEAGRQAAPKR